ncbi:rRNA maturation RNase YbeY [Saccharibacillus sp. CPCC 101409]|uniref:rRNA maturation RNase YbeY n=1 Tax=Saccharibacillus sp. CPCC 101409 TaxID=3058041 RepID=UPI002673FC9A|nr:rRNA maturation RNase YbeY [Saccharibacillus sp. CPCC 101409]MDO3409172.1 rRNA maturation RNase YbeY [Saccharibacillus sp. CPCC 101409]
MSLNLDWNNEQTDYEISEELIARLNRLLQAAGETEGVTEGEVALTFVDDEEIHRLNKEFRNIDRPTDVLSFAMRESAGDEPEMEITYEYEQGEEEGPELDEMLGDIIVSVPRAIAQSEDYGHSVERELGFLVVHGFLHLLGYDHQTAEDEAEMMGKQEAALQKVGLTR